MSNKKPPRWSVRFELHPEDDDHVRLHEHLDNLSNTDAASNWIRDTLIAALPAKIKGVKPEWKKNMLVYEDVDE